MGIVAPHLPYDHLREVAADFLTRHHPDGDLPVPIERIIELELRIDIVPMPGLLSEFDVDAYITGDLTEIRVDEHIQNARPTRYRFSLAHELAHFLVHQDVFAALKFSSIAEWKEAMNSIPEDQYRWVEIQAYGLAGLILVPPTPLADMFDDLTQKARQAGVTLQDIDQRGLAREPVRPPLFYCRAAGSVAGGIVRRPKLLPNAVDRHAHGFYNIR
jgi:hypothetical protein